jgi:ABC-type phosphate/phosphonate transport system substrate-binding protein
LLRFVSYLAPSLPDELFLRIARHVEVECGLPTSIRFERAISGPLEGNADPFADGTADVGFLCAPSYRWLRPRVELLPVLVPLDPRAANEPVYFADVVVHARSEAERWDHLRGGRWAYNDRNSRSGWFSMLERIAPVPPEAYFATLMQAGSHVDSLDRVIDGTVDGAAIDSNVLRLQCALRPELGQSLRILESWGPFPIQPVVLRSAVAPTLKSSIVHALLTLHEGPDVELERFGFRRFVEADPSSYDVG